MTPANIVISNDKGDRIELEQFVAFLNERLYEETKTRHPILCKDGPYEIATAEPGKKYIKIWVTKQSATSNYQKSIYCFLDFDGNIYKAATWRAPAKHIRGSIFDPNMSWGKSLNSYGAVYLR
jgi:hypothetical protein